MKKNGFTLIELMIVIVIIGVLSAFAVPLYANYIKETKLKEVPIALRQIANKMEQCYAEARPASYAGCNTVCTTAVPLTNFTPSCSNLAADTYTITITGTTPADLSGFIYTQTQTGTNTSTVPTNFGTGGNCLLLKKGTC